MNILDFIVGPIGGKILDKLFPDPGQKNQAQLQLIQAQQAGEFKELDFEQSIAAGQTAVNVEEAKSTSILNSGWRPAIGWICGLALGYNFILQPLLAWASQAFWQVPTPPALEMGPLMALLVPILGLGGYRTYERVNGVIPAGK